MSAYDPKRAWQAWETKVGFWRMGVLEKIMRY
jgi:hypothetical protein